MSWAEIKKAINSNISKSLDVLITEKSNEVKTVANNNNSLLNNSTYGLSALQSIISNVKSLLENTTYGLNAIKNTVNSVNNTVSVVGNIPSVKSVQRGVANLCRTYDRSRYYYGGANISISSINPNKSIVILNGGIVMSYSDDNWIADGYLYSLTRTSLVIRCMEYPSNDNSYPASWQVIEFY